MVKYVLHFMQKFYFSVSHMGTNIAFLEAQIQFIWFSPCWQNIAPTLMILYFPSFVSLVCIVQSAVIKRNLSYAGFSYPSVCMLLAMQEKQHGSLESIWQGAYF